MKVLHINSNYVYTKLHQLLVKHLSKHGIKNSVFVPVNTEKEYDLFGDVIVKNCFNNIDRYCFPIKQKKIITSVESSFDVSSYDIIHAYTLFTDGNCARSLSKKYSIPYVVAVRNTDLNFFFKKRVLLRKTGVRILQDAERVFFLSESYREQVITQYVPKQLQEEIRRKSKIIPNGIDDFWFDNLYKSNRTLNSNSIRAVFAGSIDKNKNVLTTQKAINLLNEKYNIILTVVGRVANKTEYNELMKNGKVNYIPHKEKEELLNIYRNNDFFIMPSIYESFGLVYAEAMSQGLPVLYSKGQGFDKQFPEGVVGYHVESRSPSSVAAGIEQIIENYTELSANTIKAVEKFNWKRISETYKSIYFSICNDRNV